MHEATVVGIACDLEQGAIVQQATDALLATVHHDVFFIPQYKRCDACKGAARELTGLSGDHRRAEEKCFKNNR